MAEEVLQMPHKLTMLDRRTLSISGITQVIRFDEDNACLLGGEWTLQVHGSDLKMSTLSLENGQVALTGQIDALIYEQTRPLRAGRRRRNP